jgi:phosphoglycolate phosphatase-like HAD superfamily hydrolase
MGKTVVFWDIDGTLLTTGRAGMYAWQDAFEAETGLSADILQFDSAGLPDPLIAERLLSEYAGSTDPAAARRMLRGYELRLPESLPRRDGNALPNVREILEALRERSDVYSMLLTGNTRAGARAKLSFYGLADYFQAGAFSDGASDRTAIAHPALARARDLVGEVHADRVYVVGDTPHDVQCAKAIDARAIAVATGRYTLAELQALEPWWALEQLPEAGVFLNRLGLTPVAESGWSR